VGFRYCDVSGCGGSTAWQSSFGTDNGGNIDADPFFISPASGNVRLRPGSPCIDAADGDLAPAMDIVGYPRFDDPNMPNTGTGAITYADIGAYEHYPITVLYPSDSGISFERGKTCNVEWTSDLPKGTKVKVELVKGSGGTWTLSAGASKIPFKWAVGAWKSETQAVYADGDDYKIRVSTLNGSDSDESDNDFAIGSVTSLMVSGPASVQGGAASPQYTCAAHYNFGADRDVTNEVKWSCSKIKGVKIGKTGLLATTPVSVDQPCAITAAYGKGKPPITGTLDITITP